MGQQQLLLIILGVIIVGIAVAVGITMFTSGARDSNRDAVVNDLVNLAAKAQQHYRRPVAMGGGGRTFNNFRLSTIDAQNANGQYTLSDTEPTGPEDVTASTDSIPGIDQGPLFIVGSGVETGDDGVNRVKAYVRVTGDEAAVTRTLN